MNKLTKSLARFRKDKRAIGWVLGVAFLAIAISPIIYFPLDYAWDQIYTVITAGYTFTGTIAEGIIVVKFVISYLLAFSLLFTINWAIVQAKARKYSP